METLPGLLQTKFTTLQFEAPMTDSYNDLTLKEYRLLRKKVGVNGMKMLLIYERLLLQPELIGLISKTVDAMFDMVVAELNERGENTETLKQQLEELAEDESESEGG